MPHSDQQNRSQLRITDVDDPLPTATFGGVGRFVEIAHSSGRPDRFTWQRVTIHYDADRAEHVDQWSLTLFRIDRERGTFTLIEGSVVDVDRQLVEAWVTSPASTDRSGCRSISAFSKPSGSSTASLPNCSKSVNAASKV